MERYFYWSGFWLVVYVLDEWGGSVLGCCWCVDYDWYVSFEGQWFISCLDEYWFV